MIIVLVIALAVAGATLAANDRGWLASLGISPGRRLLYGGGVGALIGLLLIPFLGLVAALIFLAASLAVVVAVALAVAALARAFSGR